MKLKTRNRNSSINILILGGDSSAGLAIIQSLGAAGYRCTLAGASQKHPAFASRYPYRRLIHPNPMEEQDAYVNWVKEEHEKYHFDLIIPPTEETLIPLHHARDEKAFNSVLAIPPAAAVELCFDKEKVRELGESLGVKSPQNILVSSEADLEDRAEIDKWIDAGAIVVKPIYSKVWKDGIAKEFTAQILTTRREFDETVRAILEDTPIQLQEWVPGRGVGVEVLARHGEVLMSFAHQRVNEVPLTGGASSYRKSITPPRAMLEDAKKLIAALSWHGVAMVEFRYDEASGRHWLMEINGRFWGSLPLATFAGADFPRALVELLLFDRQPEDPPAKVDVYARRFSREIAWFKHSIKYRNDDNPLLLKRPIREALLEWHRVFKGQEVWDGGRLSDPLPLVYDVSHALGEEIAIIGKKVKRQFLLKNAARLSLKRLNQAKPIQTIYILCYGNICRSPYAEFRLKEMTRGAYRVDSAGFHHKTDRPSPSFILEAAKARGLDLQSHRSKRIERKKLNAADIIILMDQRNYDLLRAEDPKLCDKALWLGSFGKSGIEIDDPYDEQERADEILAEIDEALAGLSKQL